MARWETVSLLRDGMAAARAGDKARTRSLLRRVTELEPQNELAWLWLANSSEDPRESLSCLRQVLVVNPENEFAASGLPEALCRAGVVAAKANDRAQAKVWFSEATDLAPRNETAWLWRAGMADSAEEGIEYLHFVLAINPNNQRATQGIVHFEARRIHKWNCPACEFANTQPHPRCPRCQAITTLEAPAAFDDIQNVERRLIEPIAKRLYNNLQLEPSSTTAYRLGLAYLNMGYAEDGLKSLQIAVKSRPADPLWPAQIQNLIHHRQTQVAQISEPPMVEIVGPNPSSILIVDDCPIVRSQISEALRDVGYTVVEAAGGYEVVDKVLQHGTPALFLLDVDMPGLDGYQLCNILRQSPDTASVPIVLMMENAGFFNKLRGRWSGAIDQLAKPFDPQVWLASMAKVVPIPVL